MSEGVTSEGGARRKPSGRHRKSEGGTVRNRLRGGSWGPGMIKWKI